jgi:hypothetical protein
MPSPSSFPSKQDAVAVKIQRWWRSVAPMRVSELKKFVSEWMAWEAGEFEECKHCGDNEAFCDCECSSERPAAPICTKCHGDCGGENGVCELWAQYDQDDLNKMDLYNRRFNGGY